MKSINRIRLLRTGLLAALALGLGACVYDPGYGYVRRDGYSGDAYYGRGTTYYDSGYYPGYYGSGYYGYGYAPAVGIGLYYSNHHRYNGSHHYGHSGHGYSHHGSSGHGNYESHGRSRSSSGDRSHRHPD